jgi:hypothetical protein
MHGKPSSAGHSPNESAHALSARWRAQSLDELLVEVHEEDDDGNDDSESHNISSISAAPALDDTAATNTSPTLRRRPPAGRLRNLFFGRRRQSLSANINLTSPSNSLHALPAFEGD